MPFIGIYAQSIYYVSPHASSGGDGSPATPFHIIHEAVEKGRHEKGAELHVVASMVQDNMGRPMTLSGYQIQLKSRWNRISGKAQGTGWSHEIEGKRFRPEAFLRKITLIEGLGEEDGD